MSACCPNWQVIEAVPIAAAGSSMSMNTSRLPAIGPDDGVKRSGRDADDEIPLPGPLPFSKGEGEVLGGGAGCVVHAQLPSTRSTARKAMMDASPGATA